MTTDDGPKMWTVYNAWPCPCPWCGNSPARHASANHDPKEPTVGDITVCDVCYRPSMFTGDGAVVTHRLRVTEADMAGWEERDRELIRLLTSQLKALQSQGVSAAGRFNTPGETQSRLEQWQ